MERSRAGAANLALPARGRYKPPCVPFRHPWRRGRAFFFTRTIPTWPRQKLSRATVRSGIGKGAARSVRREGRIPGVIYGGGDAAEPITLDYREVNKLIYAGHFLTTLFEINVDGNNSA